MKINIWFKDTDKRILRKTNNPSVSKTKHLKKNPIFKMISVTIVILLLFILLFPKSLGIFNRKNNSPPDAVFLIIVGTLRADRLSCYGYKAHKTHNIDLWASKALSFPMPNQSKRYEALKGLEALGYITRSDK